MHSSLRARTYQSFNIHIPPFHIHTRSELPVGGAYALPRAARPPGAGLTWPAGTVRTAAIREDRRGNAGPGAGVDWRGAGADAGVDLRGAVADAGVDLRGAGADAGVDLRGAGADSEVDLRAAGAGEGSGESLTLLSLWQASAATIDHDIEKT
jgi:hypothetical protein